MKSLELRGACSSSTLRVRSSLVVWAIAVDSRTFVAFPGKSRGDGSGLRSKDSILGIGNMPQKKQHGWKVV